MSNNLRHDSAFLNFAKAVGLVVVAILVIKLLGFVVGAVFGLVITAVVVLVVGALIFGVIRAFKH